MKFRGFLTSEKILLGITVTMLLVYLAINLVGKRWQERVRELDSKIVKAEREIRKSRAIIQEGEALKEKYQAYLKEFTQTSSDEKTRSSTLEEIESALSNLGLKALELKPRMEKGVEGLYNRYMVTLTLNGSLRDITRFLEKLQTKPHWFSVSQIRLDSDLSAKTGLLKASLVLERIYIDQESLIR